MLTLLVLIFPIVSIAAKPVFEVTVIATVDRDVFDKTVVDKLGGKIVYTAELAPVIVAKLPSHAVEEFKKAHGVKHVSLDG
ncbi:MAG: peptidase S8, partial [Thermoprotei archaeon]